MPNTLGHIGLQTLVTRGVLRDADVKWVWAGCLLPDVPWIGQRLARATLPGISPIDIRLYAICQSTLLFCLVLAAALACLSARPGRTWAILASGSLMHLLLDATQTKWANGVLLAAPLRWDLVNGGFYWPEDLPTLALIVLGLGVVVHAFWRLPRQGLRLVLTPGRLVGAAMLGGLYLAGPLALMPAAEAHDLHHTALLRPGAARAGQEVAFDRARVDVTPEGAQLMAWTGARFALTGLAPQASGTWSVQGVLGDGGEIVVTALHAHPPGLRDLASYVGLACVALWWGLCLWRPGGRRP
ncbi:hypothetical protein [Marinibacterium sp. SX1]|uniref:hypothetical protein n=1 Tax=Marinibacterium sp. SX1 TaxID=3388424 RepID=UPI003D17E489